MFAITVLSLMLSSGADPLPATGWLSPPAYDLHGGGRPHIHYDPQPGDILLFSDTNIFWSGLYAIALSARPGHSGIVIRMPDGSLGVFEAGYNDTPWMRINPLSDRLYNYKGVTWIRQRTTPLTEQQSLCLTQFALAAQDRLYSVVGFSVQITPFRTRGPIRTFFIGKPPGIGYRYHCAEAVMEACVYAGLLPAATTRPSATFPRDMFFDRSPNIYINRHLDLVGAGWQVPAMWSPSPLFSPKLPSIFSLR